MLCGLLVHQGLLDVVPTFIVFYAADLVGDIGWYWIGRRWGHDFIARWGTYISITEAHVATVSKFFDRYHTPILLFSKVTMGLGFPGATLFTAGLTRISFGKYMALNALGQCIWTAVLLGIGYYLGNFYARVNGALGMLSTLALAAIILALLFGGARYVRNTLTEKTL
jgi:membrane protein DedA with SNARE-associated domain